MIGERAKQLEDKTINQYQFVGA